MKKLFFFRSSSDKKVHFENSSDSKMKPQASDQAEEDFNSPKSQSPALTRSLSLSSAGFVFESSTTDLTGTTKTQDKQRNHSSRQVLERRCESNKFQYDSPGSSTSSSSKALDRYINGEEDLQRCNKNGTTRRRLPPRGQRTAPTSPSNTFNDKQKSHSFIEAKGSRLRFSSTDFFQNGGKNESTHSLARDDFERLSQTHSKSTGSSNHEPITIQDVYDRTFDSNPDVAANSIHGKNMNRCMEEEIDSELEIKIKEAEKRLELFSEELEQKRRLSSSDFDVSSMASEIRKLEDERVNLAVENVSLLRSQMVEKTSAKEEIRRVKSDLGLHIQRIEKEKNEVHTGLEKELDRRSSDWTSKLEKFDLEEKKLRERVRELAEQNVSLQRELSAFHEKETKKKDMITHLERKVAELTTTAEEFHEENSSLKQTLSKLQESYAGATADLDFVRRNFEEKEQECKELHKSVTKLLRTCKEQEKTIEGLRDGVSEQPSEKLDPLVKILQMEQVRLTGIELSLRREVESMKLEADTLRYENTRLLNRLKENGEDDITTVKLETEMKMRVHDLQDQGLSMLNESNQLCYKILKFIKEKLTQFPETYQDSDSMKDGLSEQFMIESEMKIHGIRRGIDNLKRSLETVTSVVASKSESSCSNTDKPKEQRNKSVEETLRAELRAETLITSLLREKLYSKEQEIEQLQAEVAAAVQGNEILKCEVQRSLDNLSVKTHELKDLKNQMLKKEENISRLEINLQEAMKDIESMKAVLTKVSDERDQIWRELRHYSENNMILKSEKEMLKGMVEKLEEKVLEKEGEITILHDTIGNKHLNLLSSANFLV